MKHCFLGCSVGNPFGRGSVEDVPLKLLHQHVHHYEATGTLSLNSRPLLASQITSAVIGAQGLPANLSSIIGPFEQVPVSRRRPLAPYRASLNRGLEQEFFGRLAL